MDWALNSRTARYRASLPARTWTLALLQGTSAVGLSAMAAAPLGGAAPTDLYAACGCALALSALTLLAVGAQMGERALLTMAGLRVAIAAVAMTNAHSAGAALFGGAGLVWVAVWVTGFFPGRTAVMTVLAEIVAVVAAVVLNVHHLRTAVDSVPILSASVILSTLLSQVLGNLRHEARHDLLTGLLNRRGLDQALRDLATSRMAGTTSLVLIDLDGLKLVNDHAGHLAGDQMLVTFATELQTAARGVDLTARIGGDEFVAILPGLTRVEATRWVDELHASSGVTWSFGVAQRNSGEALEPWLGRADKLMYAAKAATRSTRVQRERIPAFA